MSKNLTRKGLALGTALSFGLAGLVGTAPAHAAAGDYVSLAPALDGSNYNTVLGYDSGIYGYMDIATTIDPDVNSQNVSQIVKVENPGLDDIGLYFAEEDGEVTHWNYNAPQVFVNGTAQAAVASATLLQADEEIIPDNVTSDAFKVYDDAVQYYVVPTGTNFGIQTSETSGEVNLKVSTWFDKELNTLSVATPDFKLDANEAMSLSETESVNFYAPASIVATTKLVTDVLDANDTSVTARVSFSNSLNTKLVPSWLWGTVLLKDGSPVVISNPADEVATDTSSSTTASVKAKIAYASGSTDSDGSYIELSLDNVDGIDDGADADALGFGSFSARTAYLGEFLSTNDDKDIAWAGARSESFSIAKGTNTAVIDLTATVSDSKNANQPTDVNDDRETIDVRSGIKSVTLTAQAMKAGAETEDADVALKASNVRVKATVTTFSGIVDGSKLSVAGSSTVIDSGSGTATVFGRTDAAGQFPVTVTNSGAVDGESYLVTFSYLTTEGLWSEAEAYTIAYEDAVVAAFEAKSAILAGPTVTAEFKVEDQFGQPINKLAEGSLSVNLVDDSAASNLDKVVAVADGKAVFSFSNYVAKGDAATLSATLFYGSDKTDLATVPAGSDNPVSVSLFNPEATGSIVATEELTGEVTYSDFVTGDPEADSDADTVAPYEFDSQLIEGTVEDVNGAGLPGAVVVVSGVGLQFEDATELGTFYKDSITVIADELGEYSVNVWTHKVTADGVVITSTSGGKSATTTFIATHNDTDELPAPSVDAGALTAEDLKFSWNAPSVVVTNTTYVVTATVTDKWGNAIEGAELDYSASGALEVNGREELLAKKTNAKGNSTVYVRSVVDALGFGDFAAVLKKVTVGATVVDASTEVVLTTFAGEDDVEDTLSIEYNVVKTAPAVATANASGSTGKVFVSVTNAAGKKVVVKVSGKFAKSFTGTAAKKTVAIAALKGKRTVTIFVGGVLVSTKVVTIK